MVIIFTEPSIIDLQSLVNGYYKYKKTYVIGLLEYIKILEEMPYIGRELYKTKYSEIRQLIYKKHKIIYQVQDNTILINLIIHNSTNLENFFQ